MYRLMLHGGVHVLEGTFVNGAFHKPLFFFCQTTMSTETDETRQSLLLEQESRHTANQHTHTEGAKMPNRKGPSGASRLKKCIGLFFEILYWLLTLILVQFWKACTAVALSLMLTYWLWGGWATFCLMIAALIGIFYNLQDSVLYFPNEPESSRLYVPPATALGIPFEYVTITTPDKVHLSAVLFKQRAELAPGVPTIVFLHGNAGNIGHRYMNLHELYAMCGCNILAVDYRGYGKSEGVPSEEGLYVDAEAAVNYLHSRSDIDQSAIILFGRSLGGAVAVHIAAHRHNRDKLAGLILENTFTSIPDMGSVLFNLDFVRWMPLCLIKNKYFSIRKVSRIQVPTLFLSGSSDELVPPKMMQALFRICGAPSKQMARFEEGTHNETWRCRGYFSVIRQFTATVCRPGSNVMEPSPSPTPGPSLADYLGRVNMQHQDV
ncbi:protein ABHD13-like [Amphiura filiformis]|uniref:protein ABHD13-like n=1 Tax=Amphiura filiformis TaxID=82378 RepID=UPI003B218AD2